MYLKSIEMQGFKSFPDRTKLMFDRDGSEVKTQNGVTVIVGPNGSGKSNIADAMRWVLGEISNKSLRSTKLEDVIFGGADSRRPMGFAEVSVTFDNTVGFGKLECPYDEVVVTRRYYRAGESEYFINRKAVRLKDIYELFMNTGIGREGYSIIGQGKIAEMVSRKSEERRSIFEDASGISKFRYKKNEAERNLAATEDNMVRVMDIFAEVEAQIGPLEKESVKAKRALELMDTKKQADVSLWLYDTEKIRGQIATAQENFRRSSFDLQNATDSLQSLEQKNEKLFEASQTNKLASERLLSQIREQTDKNHRLESEYQVAQTNRLHADEMIESSQNTMAGVVKARDQEKANADSHEQNIRAIELEIESLNEEQLNCSAEKNETENHIARLEDEIAIALEDLHVLESEQMDVRVRRSVLEKNQDAGEGRNEDMIEQLEQYRSVSSKLEEQCRSREQSVNEYAERIGEIDASTEGLRQKADELEKVYLDLDQKRYEHLNQRESLSQKIATIQAMEENFEGYSGSVKYVMNAYKAGRITTSDGLPCGKIYGPLSTVIRVEDAYITAIEIALGSNLQNIVVENEETAKAAMYSLKKAEAGRATFFPLTSMREQTVTPEMKQAMGFEGFIAVADSLVSCDSKFSRVVSSLLGRIIVFDTIDHAIQMAKAVGYRVRTVTLDGQQINAGGSFTGGSVRQGHGVLSRAGEIARYTEERNALDAQLKTDEKEVGEAREAFNECKSEAESQQDQKELMTVLMNSEQAELEKLRAQIEANETLMDKVRKDFESLSEETLRMKEEKASLEKEDADLGRRMEEISAVRQEKNEEKAALEDQVEKLGQKATDLYIQISEKNKDVDTEKTLLSACLERMNADEATIAEIETKIQALEEQKASLDLSMEQNREEATEGERLLEDLNARRSEVEADSFAFESKLSEINSQMRDKMAEKELIIRENTANESRLNSLQEENDKLSTKLWDDYEMTRAEAVELNYPPVTAENHAEMVRLQTECRNKLRAIGNVDLDSVEKYKEVKERYDYMSHQISDLQRSKTELTGIIQNLESEMKTAFVDAFNAINENFNKTFAELFGGGSAELSLSDPENVLESGIEIKAAPPGKIIKNLMQLSGGEQAFIGVALFFAILQVNPTPFCILDEIEAALDEVNVERLAAYIKRYSQGTQFILITHRRGPMAAADRLYGVTMPERGISKVLVLNVDDISREKGGEWDGIFGKE